METTTEQGLVQVRPALEARELIQDIIGILLLLELCCCQGIVACSLAGKIDGDAYYTKHDLHGREARAHTKN